MGRVKAYKVVEPEETYHMGTVEPDYTLEDGTKTHCLEFLNGAIKKYGWVKEVYLKDLFKYIEELSLSYIQQFFKDSQIGNTVITNTKPHKMITVQPIYLINRHVKNIPIGQEEPVEEDKKEYRLRNVELAFIYGAINQYDRDDKYDKIELLGYIVKTCKNYFDDEARREKLRKKGKE